MITGFGNNVISSLAADITAGQTTIQVMPGTGAKFAGLLTYDYANASNPLQTYAKITLTDTKETVFEICHLISVNNDVLTVVRGQEGTLAKGWALNDVIANFATRGSENQFVQIEQLQSGHYISGVAGGTANALTLELPATYFVNGATGWTLRTPIVVYPTQNNTGPSTLQLTMGGRVLGTFKLYKGNKAELVANDILKDTGLVCLLDNTKTFFNVTNPGAIYAGLGTAAFCDVQTSKDDVTSGRVLVNGSAIALRSVTAKGSGGTYNDVNSLPRNSVSFIYSDAENSPGFSASMIDFSGLWGSYNAQFAAQYDGSGNRLSFRTHNGNENVWNPWYAVYHTGNKPTAADTNALPIPGGTMTGEITGAYTGGDSWGAQYNSKAPFYNLFSSSGNSDYHPLIKQKGTTSSNSWAFSQGMMNSNGSLTWLLHMRGSAGNDVQFSWDTGGNYGVPGRINPGDFGNFDARYNKLNTANKAQSGWSKDNSTGVIMQWGYIESSNGTFNFPTSFPNQCFVIVVGNTNAGGGRVDNAYGWAVGNSQFFVATKDSNSGNITNYPVSWVAFGN